MIPEKWKDLLEILGVIAIIASLVLVAYELRQNTAVLTAQAAFQLSTALDSSYRARAENPDLAQLIKNGHTAPESLSDVQRDQFAAWLRADLNALEAAWFYAENGVIPETALDAYKNAVCSRVITEGGRQYWQNEAQFFSSSLKERIDSWCF